MKSFVCVLKSGGVYTPEHVQILKRMVERHIPSVDEFVCYTDTTIPGVQTVPLKLRLRGKYSMVEAFRHTGQVLVTGLDTIFIKNIDKVWGLLDTTLPTDFWMIKAFNPDRVFANGIMGWNGDWSWMFDAFQDASAYYTNKLEQEFTIKKLRSDNANIRTFNEHLNLYSFKKHCRKHLPEDADVVLFHGHPRPHQTKVEWVKELYK